jgi:hypothetical protein
METKNYPTYKTQFDKLTRAYINGQVDMCDCSHCFVGNLLNNEWRWAYCRNIDIVNAYEYLPIENAVVKREEFEKLIIKESNGFYTPEEVLLLEREFMGAGREIGDCLNEDRLFYAFEKTLELLKKIHLSKGENIEQDFIFQKRKAANQTQK